MGRTDPPTASRPHMPGYGIPPADAGPGLLPWSWAVERLQSAHNYWVATVRPDGLPHLAAVWGIWDNDTFYFSTGGRSRKARNLRSNPRCVITPEHADKAVVVEGKALRVTDRRRLDSLQARFTRKYQSGFPDPDANPVFAVRPDVVFGMIEHDPDFNERATRWTFTR